MYCCVDDSYSPLLDDCGKHEVLFAIWVTALLEYLNLLWKTQCPI